MTSEEFLKSCHVKNCNRRGKNKHCDTQIKRALTWISTLAWINMIQLIDWTQKQKSAKIELQKVNFDVGFLYHLSGCCWLCSTFVSCPCPIESTYLLEFDGRAIQDVISVRLRFLQINWGSNAFVIESINNSFKICHDHV